MLTLTINQNDSAELTQVRLGSSGPVRQFIAEQNAQAFASIPLTPGGPEPQILSAADMVVDFQLGILVVA